MQSQLLTKMGKYGFYVGIKHIKVNLTFLMLNNLKLNLYITMAPRAVQFHVLSEQIGWLNVDWRHFKFSPGVEAHLLRPSIQKLERRVYYLSVLLNKKIPNLKIDPTPTKSSLIAL